MRHNGAAVPGVESNIRFFLRTDSVEPSPSWLASLSRVIVQHPPEGHRFVAEDDNVVQLRVVDREMDLGLEQAAQMMIERGA